MPNKPNLSTVLFRTSESNSNFPSNTHEQFLSKYLGKDKRLDDLILLSAKYPEIKATRWEILTKMQQLYKSRISKGRDARGIYQQAKNCLLVNSLRRGLPNNSNSIQVWRAK